MKKRLLFCFLVVCQFYLAQDTDTVFTNLDKEKVAAKKITLYSHYIDILKTKDVSKSLKLSSKAIAFAKEQKDPISEADFIRLRGLTHYLGGNLDSANNYYHRSLSILESHSDSKQLANLYNNLGQLNRKIQNYPKSIEYYDKSMQIFTSIKDDEGIATIYNESGVVYEYMKNYEEAKSRYIKSLNIQKKRGDLVGQGYSLEFIGGVSMLQKKYAEAEKYLTESLSIRKKTKDNFAIALNYNVLGHLFLEKKEYRTAAENFIKSNQIATTIPYMDLMRDNYLQLSNVDKEIGNYKGAYENQELFVQYNDSIFTAEKMKQIEEISVKYETEKKDKEILIHKSKIFKRNVALLSLSGLLIFGFGYYKNFRHRQKIKFQKEILHQQDLATKAAMSAEDNERKRMAMHLHDGVGQMLNATNMNLQVLEEYQNNKEGFEMVMNKTRNILTDAMTEVRTLSHQIMPNMLVKNSLSNALRELIDKSNSPKLHINLTIDGLQEDLAENVQIVMFRIIQECINNTIKHANASEIDIAVKQDSNEISASFRDNGRGFDPTLYQSKSEGMGLENIKSRIEFLKGYFQLDSEKSKGTSITVKIPI
ncbi:sensor histidine kinase [Chryseobacterium suipulveris]|uniref:Oxygen sensor histidine kinase NreB n=1 Tax=Chryseobacterium suipulveris TaxID=2929800 RepID=A0ABY4BKN8_9FLAO|nr:sensor histidine kinase [Chryseobacterium suipulveris]UOE39762.1 sensor histidine kinase [Chryseobacterium suipulveris]